jgi:hypothetical protein
VGGGDMNGMAPMAAQLIQMLILGKFCPLSSAKDEG